MQVTDSATENTFQSHTEDSRVIQRISMQLPIKVEVRVADKLSWEEITRIRDVSTLGAGFVLSRPVKRGRLLFVTVPMPRNLRIYDFAEPQYCIWGIVRRCIRVKSATEESESYSVGIGFIGKEPPDSYWENPSTVYELGTRREDDFWNITRCSTNPDESNLPAEVRRHSRYQLPTNVMVEILDDNGDPIASELTATENLSLSGAAIYTTFSPSVGDFVRVNSEQYDVSIISIVRGVRVGEDNIQRLHLEFIDRFFPLEGIV